MNNKSKISNRRLDRIDRAILTELQKDGRVSNVELSQRVNLSPSPCLERVRRLEAEGYIDGYGAYLNADRLKLSKIAFIQVTLDHMTQDVFEQFKEAVLSNPYVAECHMVAGGYDYLVKVRFEDMDSYRLVLEKVVELPHVNQTHTYVVIEEIKHTVGIPMELVSD